MKIAVLGWGSLIWQPKELKFDKHIGWDDKGAFLPIEFSRISNDGRLTLVIDKNAQLIQTLFAVSLYEKLDEAILDLDVREGCAKNKIGRFNKVLDKFIPEGFSYQEEIKEWIKYTDFDAVIWTNLPEKWVSTDKNGGEIDIKPEERVNYLRSLNGVKKTLAEEYIRKTPKQVFTAFRREIEEKLGWTYIDNEI